jgi:hypothetical protein
MKSIRRKTVPVLKEKKIKGKKSQHGNKRKESKKKKLIKGASEH